MTKRYWVQVLLLTIVTFACVAPKTYKTGLLIVSRTYSLASDHLLSGVSPYKERLHNTEWLETDWFKYSPLLALGYTPMTWLPNKVHALLWVWINTLFFWMGVCSWIRLDRKTSPWIWFAILVASFELNISLVHQQINGLLCGMIFLGVAAYKQHAYTRAANILSLATNFKVIPLPLLGVLGLQMRRNYLFYSVLTLTGAFLIPGLFIGFETNLQFHLDWIQLLAKDIHSQGIADIQSLMERLGFPILGAFLRWSVLFLTAGFMAMPVVTKKEDPDWVMWVSTALLGITLWNPRTESPTFVIVAPLYVLLMQRWLGPGSWRKLGRVFLVGCSFLITISFTDLWPRTLWDPGNPVCAAKTMGTMMLFVVVIALSFRDMFLRQRQEQPNALTHCRLAIETP
ncbi:MAG: DUF2029 domain-containing protein [Bdellovibrionales bacterium]|nr:DUF2029 domain-containing protein [Bdellovibrionales bacterium]